MSSLVVDADMAVPMRDGTVLRADVYRSGERGALPALLMRTPYGKHQLPALLTVLEPVRAARAGFAVVQDTRGRYASEGRFTPFDERSDGHDTLTWLAAQPWCDGRVGMFGSSYMAATQLQASIGAPGALRAICPIEASSDYGDGRSYRGGAFELGALATIALWALARGELQRAPGGGYGEGMAEVRAALADLEAFLSVRPLNSLRDSVLGRAAPYFFDWAHHQPGDQYWHERSIEPGYPEVSVPGLHVTSWFDQYHVGTLRNYEGLRSGAASEAARSAQTLIVGPWAHFIPRSSMLGAVRVGDVDFGLDALVDLEALQLRWFREHVAEETGAWRQRAPVRLFVMGEDRWRDEASWPVEGASVEPLHLAPSGRLDWDAGAAEAVARYEFDPDRPVRTHGGAHLVLESAHPSGPVEHRWLAPRPDVLVFTGAPLAAPLEVVGWIEATLRVRSSAPCTDFTVKLLDVGPDGAVVNIVDGIARVPAADRPDATGWVTVRVALGATAILLRPGHALRVDVSSSNFPRFDVNPNTGESAFTATEVVVARQEVCVGGPSASYVALPIRRWREPA